MPWDLLGNWTDGPITANEQFNAQGQAAQQQAGLQNAEQVIMRHMQAHQAALAQQGTGGTGGAGYGGNPWGQGQAAPLGGGFNDYMQARQQRVRFDVDNFAGLLDEFNTAFQHGIREVIVDLHTYLALLNHFNRYTDQNRGALHLRIATAGGNLTVRPEGPKMPTGEDFDRYMEDVDGNAP